MRTLRLFVRTLHLLVTGGVAALVMAPFLALLLAFAVCYFPALGCVFAVRIGLSKLFPRSWAIDWENAFKLDPTWGATCPQCAAPLTLGPVDPRGCVRRNAQGGEGHAFPTQTATCAACGEFRRVGMGKMWHGWQDQPA